MALNENEERLLSDIQRFFLDLAPPDRPWLHNDLHLRQGGFLPMNRAMPTPTSLP